MISKYILSNFWLTYFNYMGLIVKSPLDRVHAVCKSTFVELNGVNLNSKMSVTYNLVEHWNNGGDQTSVWCAVYVSYHFDSSTLAFVYYITHTHTLKSQLLYSPLILISLSLLVLASWVQKTESMAAKSKNVQVIASFGKHIVNGVRSRAIPGAVASDLFPCRYIFQSSSLSSFFFFW